MFKIEIVRNNKNQEPEPQQEIEKSPETVLQELRYKRMELLTEYRSTKADLVKNGPHPKSAAGMEVLDPIIEKLAQTSCQIGEVRDKNNITFNPLKYYLDKTERLKEVRKWTEGEFINTEIGKEIHEDPYIPNYSNNESNIILKEGMTLAIEPMFNLKRKEVNILEDGWTIVTEDEYPSAHFEHTVVVTKDGYEIITGE